MKSRLRATRTLTHISSAFDFLTICRLAITVRRNLVSITPALLTNQSKNGPSGLQAYNFSDSLSSMASVVGFPAVYQRVLANNVKPTAFGRTLWPECTDNYVAARPDGMGDVADISNALLDLNKKMKH
jgi:hypothetical protein